MKRLSKRGGLLKSALYIILGVIIIKHLLPLIDVKIISFIFNIIILAAIFVRLLTRSLSYDDQYIKLGNSKLEYDGIENLWWFGYNFEHYVIFKIKNQPFYSRYKFVDLRTVSFKDIFKLITKKEQNLPQMNFINNLKNKTSLPHSKIDKVFREE